MFWGCVSGVRGHHAKLSFAADAESVKDIWAVIWTPAFRFDDGVPLMGQAIEKERNREMFHSIFKLAWIPIFVIIIHLNVLPTLSFLIKLLKLCTLYLLLQILFAAVFSLLLSYLSSYASLHLLSRHLYLHVPITFCIHLFLFYARLHSQRHIPFPFRLWVLFQI